MNVHHLELFYYVAQHRGISQAVLHMPYGIQQPAVSTQIGRLEQEMGVRLFERSPFRLTKPGEELFDFVRPFFANLDAVAARIGKPSAPTLRVGAAELMLRDYMPSVVSRLQELHPKLQFSLRSGFTTELHAALRAHEIDLAIMPHLGNAGPGMRCLRLLRIPLVLLVPKNAKLNSASELWQRERIETPLISLPEHELVTRVFRKGLKRLWVDWPCALEASSLDLVAQYVVSGHGYGVNVQVAKTFKHPKLRSLPLEGFDPVDIAVVWMGKPSPLVQAFLDVAQKLVAERWPEWTFGGTATNSTTTATTRAPAATRIAMAAT